MVTIQKYAYYTFEKNLISFSITCHCRKSRQNSVFEKLIKDKIVAVSIGGLKSDKTSCNLHKFHFLGSDCNDFQDYFDNLYGEFAFFS
jgi:hypothetical protein